MSIYLIEMLPSGDTISSVGSFKEALEIFNETITKAESGQLTLITKIVLSTFQGTKTFQPLASWNTQTSYN